MSSQQTRISDPVFSLAQHHRAGTQNTVPALCVPAELWHTQSSAGLCVCRGRHRHRPVPVPVPVAVAQAPCHCVRHGAHVICFVCSDLYVLSLLATIVEYLRGVFQVMFHHIMLYDMLLKRVQLVGRMPVFIISWAFVKRCDCGPRREASLGRLTRAELIMR